MIATFGRAENDKERHLTISLTSWATPVAGKCESVPFLSAN